MIARVDFRHWYQKNPWYGDHILIGICTLTGVDIPVGGVNNPDIRTLDFCYDALCANRPDLTLDEVHDYMAARAGLEGWRTIDGRSP